MQKPKMKKKKVHAVAQWVQNLTTVAWVAMEAQVQSLAQELPYAAGVAIKKEKKKKGGGGHTKDTAQEREYCCQQEQELGFLEMVSQLTFRE